MPLQSLVEAQARHLPRGSTTVLITPSASELVFQTADILLRRGLRPVAVLLNGASFGGYFGSERVAVSLKSLGIPVCEVSEGDNLSNALSMAMIGSSWSSI